MLHLVPVAPPAQVEKLSGFDYMTADAARDRIYAAHTGSRALLVVNSTSGAVLGQVEVGPMHGVAVDPDSGHVYTGDGESRTVSEVDPVSLKVLRTADVDGKVDAMLYDPGLHRLYADEDDGTRMFVVDSAAMKEIATIPLPGHKPEYLAIDPETHDVYQNIDDLGEVVVIDPTKLAVVRTFRTPEIKHNHPLLYDAAYHVLVIGGKNGVLASYTRDGKLLATAPVPAGVDQCDLDATRHRIACAGSDKVIVLDLAADGALTVEAQADAAGVHTVTFDAKTGNVWIVWAGAKGDFVQQLTLR